MAQILDQYGHPIQREVLSEPQTSRLGHLYQEYANHPSRGLTPQRLHSILVAAEQGDLTAQYDLFTDMEEKDGHILAEMGKRKNALLGLDWDIVAPKGAGKDVQEAAAFARDLIESIEDLEDVVTDLMDAVGHGFSALEIEWGRMDKWWVPAALNWRPQSWFVIPQGDQNEIRLRTMQPGGEDLRAFGWIVHRHKAKSGYVARGGLHRTLAWPYLFKNYSARDLAEFLEIYGLPLRLGKYPSGASDIEKSTLLRAVTQIGHAAAGIIPEGMSIDFQEAAKGASDPYLAMIDWCERTESKVILGQVLSAEAKATGMGSGVADLQGEVRSDIRASDARQISSTLTRQLVYPLLALNRGWADPRQCPRFLFDTGEAEDLSLYAEALPKLVGIGVQVPVDWAHDKLRIPKPQEGEAVLGKPQELTLPVAVNRAALSANLAGHPVFTDQAALDTAIDALPETMLDQQARDAIEPLIRMVLDAADPSEVMGRLAEMYPGMDTDALQETLTRLLFAAELWGRINADAELG